MGIYNIMFYGGLILTAIFLIASIIIFIKMRIPEAFGVVTGRTQKKAIEEIRTGGRTTTSGSKRKKIGNIQARDIKVSNSGKSAPITSHTGVQSSKATGESAESIAKRAAEDARRKVQSSEEQSRRNLEEESTEVLTYNEMKTKGEASEDPTTVLEMEQATDILSQGNAEYGDERADDATDVLTGNGTVDDRELVDDDLFDDEPGDEKTDVLRSSSGSANLYNKDLDDDVDKTDVLTAEMEDLSDKDVYGTYNPETTSVLRSDMAPGSDSVKKSGGLNREGIKVLYSETIVHTEESL